VRASTRTCGAETRIGHVDVHHDNIRLKRECQIDRLLAGAGLPNDSDVAFVGEEFPDTLANDVVVVGDYYPNAHRCLLRLLTSNDHSTRSVR
jgi:hypothetical protein